MKCLLCRLFEKVYIYEISFFLLARVEKIINNSTHTQNVSLKFKQLFFCESSALKQQIDSCVLLFCLYAIKQQKERKKVLLILKSYFT